MGLDEKLLKGDNMNTFRDGFTLIELMIVVAIVAILAAIAIPNFMKLKEKAAINAAYASLQNLRKAIETYKSLHDEGKIPQNYTELKNALGKHGAELFLFDLENLRSDMKKFAYGANTNGRYTLAALALDNDDTCVWVNDRKNSEKNIKDCSDNPAPSSGLSSWDIDLTN